jgi:hypothetical protein
VTRVAQVAGLALLLVAAGLGLWLGLRGRSSSARPELGPTKTGPERSVTPLGPIALSAAGLRARSTALGQDVYWLGGELAGRYELERAADGNVFVRYLSGGALDTATVGTYPLENAYTATVDAAAEPGWAKEHVEGWLVVRRASSETEVYLATQGFPYQIEVYDPIPGRARTLVESGAVTPVH